ncbi:ABC transporter ATP-binding protein [Hazenella coriacea]|uniref:ABC-type multidrug transport system ATPase subunit n=1 Tax=Hazenella coriacea TaxID=1179467 RepID=A0A4R3LA15_9BACL|nr:ABC transporter ATP-binding protein [Hazenella coriacea]TCS96951.1 ABC-type multidrug transport system ATPase subunit [Hazenella coriacea]
MIRMENVSKQYDGRRVIHQVQLHVKSGELFGLVGNNGAGKSTTIHLLAGIIHSTTGTIRILEEPPGHSAYFFQNVGIVTENQSYFNEMSALEHMLFFNKVKGQRQKRQQLREILRLVELDPTNQKTVQQFSQGMKKRLGIALALLSQPQILLFDEPTTSLDPSATSMVYSLFQDLAQQGTTLFLTSSHREECESICTRMGILENGSIRSLELNPT